MLGQLRRERNKGDFPELLLFHSADPKTGDAFFADHWPEVSSIADPALVFFDAFGIEHGRLGQILGAKALVAGLRALLGGVLPGRPAGDLMRLPGLVLVQGDEILWQQFFEHSGTTARFETLRTRYEEALGQQA